MDFNIIEYIKKQNESFADAFPDISHISKKWGFIFEWDNSNHFQANFALITKHPEEELKWLIDWVQKDNTRKIYLEDQISINFNSLTAVKKISLFYRPYKKIDSPILTDIGLTAISYRTLQRDYNLKETMNHVAEIEMIPNEGILEFHKFLGGHMHLFEGTLWLLDKDGAILSCGLTSELDAYKDIISIELMTTRIQVRGNGHSGSLLQSILSANKKKNFIILSEMNNSRNELLKKFNFQETHSFTVYKTK